MAVLLAVAGMVASQEAIQRATHLDEIRCGGALAALLSLVYCGQEGQLYSLCSGREGRKASCTLLVAGGQWKTFQLSMHTKTATLPQLDPPHP